MKIKYLSPTEMGELEILEILVPNHPTSFEENHQKSSNHLTSSEKII
jgi:hypothetical protein